MTTGTNNEQLEQIGAKCYGLISDLYPICRSITGNGFRETLRVLQGYIPLTLHEVPTGTRAFDWTVPKEWNVHNAWIKSVDGRTVVDLKNSNLHVVSYSVPVCRRMKLEELREHLFTVPSHPEWIPYRTSYYSETWGFCLTERQRQGLQDEEYDVLIDATLENGSLTYGELLLPGARTDEVLISCHACHPSMCNDNLSGVAVSTFLARALADRSTEYSYRFLFIPGTIGSIVWLSQNEQTVPNIKHGLVLAGVGDRGNPSYKKSRKGEAEIDRAFIHLLQNSGGEYRVEEFSPYGYDERQYCSPGFDLPVGRFSRTPHGQYPEYHTSADNLNFVDSQALADSYRKCVSVIEILERNKTFINQKPKCEPQLGRRNLYRTLGGYADTSVMELAVLWVLNQSDGSKTLLDIAERSKISFTVISEAASILQEYGLLEEVQANISTHDEGFRASPQPDVRRNEKFVEQTTRRAG